MTRLQKQLKKICESGPTALWFSAGKDSRLLLESALAVDLPITFITQDDGWTREQRQQVDELVVERGVSVYSYRPTSALMFGEGDEITVAAFYVVDQLGAAVPVFRDLVHSDSRCGRDDLKFELADTAPVFFQNHVIGSKRGEKHYAFGGADTVPASKFNRGDATFHAPLYDWTDADVIKCLKKYGIDWPEVSETADTGNLVACTKCFRSTAPVLCPKSGDMVEAFAWNPSQNLKFFRGSK